MATIRLPVDGPFSLAASTRFLEGFAPAAYHGAAPGHLDLAFPVEGDWRTAGACVQADGADVVLELSGDADRGAAAAQVRRILSLDVDGSGFPAVGDRDRVIGGLQRRYPGLRPVGFCSAYEAAAWALIGQRVRIAQAAATKQRIAEALGDRVEVDGELLAAFPGPATLAELGAMPGLTDRKVGWLRELGAAALAGVVDGAALRALDEDTALERLRGLGGIGPFSAELTLLRGACAPDVFPRSAGRLHATMRERYGEPDADVDRLAVIAERWRPYRSWCAVLLRVAIEDDHPQAS